MKTLPKLTRSRVCGKLLHRVLGLGILTLAAASAGYAVVISVNVASAGNIASGTGGTMIDGSETFGVAELGTVVGNWTNMNFSTAAAKWDDGSLSTVSAAITNPGGYSFSGAAYVDTPLNYGPAHYSGTPDTPGTTLTFSNLNANFPDGFYAVVYLTGGTANTGALITDSTSTFYYQTANPAALPGTLMQATTTTDLGDGNAPIAQYAVFGSPLEPIFSDSISFRVDTVYGGYASIGGAQLVAIEGIGAIPEPAALSLLMGIFVGGVLLNRRRRA